MSVKDKAIIITGANRGLGLALVEEALRRGARRVYAATRQEFSHDSQRVTPVLMDLTSPSQIKLAIDGIDGLDMVVNNAGFSLYEDFTDRTMLNQHLAINLVGPYDLIQATLPLLRRSHGTIVNVLSLASLAPSPFNPSYSVSKAAAFAMSQAFRALLAKDRIKVHAVLPGPMDTEMTRALDIPKARPEMVAMAIFDGLEKGEEEIFPDPMSATMADGWRNSALKALERQMAAYVDTPPVQV